MEYAVGTTKSMSMLHNLCEAGRAKLNRSLPRKGIWKLGIMMGLLSRKARKEEIENAMRFSVHPKFDELENDFNQFFSDIDFYTRYGQSGMRKVLFTGPREQARQLSQKLWGQSIRISMFLFMPTITSKMFVTPLLRRKYLSLL